MVLTSRRPFRNQDSHATGGLAMAGLSLGLAAFAMHSFAPGAASASKI
jgi:hypothetical protein